MAHIHTLVVRNFLLQHLRVTDLLVEELLLRLLVRVATHAAQNHVPVGQELLQL